MSWIKRLPLVALAFVLTNPQPATAAQCGDLDANGNIVSSDALLLLRYAVGQSVTIGCPGGLNCWDTDTDGVCDAAEDKDGDLSCGVTDCQGAKGNTGSTGAPGAPGAVGPTGPTGAPGVNASEEGLMVLSSSGMGNNDGVAVLVSGDDEVAVASLPFFLRIGNQNYGRVAISTNGWIQFLPACIGFDCIYTKPVSDFNNTALPTNLVGNSPFLAAFWDDLEATVYTGASGTAPNRVFLIIFGGPRHALPDNSFLSAQVRLHETSNLIHVEYYTVQNAFGDTATIGFQAQGGLAAKTYPLGFNANTLGLDGGGDSAQSWSIAPVR